jgi:glycosyltransferase involved in cell wall biosynthesis
MHIATITFDWYPFEPRVLRMVRAAEDAGHTVDVICLKQPYEEHYEEYNRVHVYRLAQNRHLGHSLLATIAGWCWFLLRAAFLVARLHLKRRYAIVHVHNMPDFLVFSALVPKLAGAKIILDIQDVSPELMAARARGCLRPIITLLAGWQERLSIAFANHVVTVGTPFEERLLQRGVPPEKLSIIINSADPRLFPPERRVPLYMELASAVRPFVLMYHGTVVERTGVDIAIRALALARRHIPELRLHVQGRDEHQEYLPVLKRLAEELGVADAMLFRGSSPPGEIVDFIVQGDIGIIPYRCDGFMELVLPTKAYEYAWMQCPIIASNTYAIRSMFRPGSIALCDPACPEQFADAIIDLCQSPEKRARMVVQACEDYQPYRWELAALRYQQLLAAMGTPQVAAAILLPEEQVTSEPIP